MGRRCAWLFGRLLRRRAGQTGSALLLQYAATVAVVAIFVPILMSLHAQVRNVTAEARLLTKTLEARGTLAASLQEFARDSAVPPVCSNPERATGAEPVKAAECLTFESASEAVPKLWHQKELPHLEPDDDVEHEACFVSFAGGSARTVGVTEIGSNPFKSHDDYALRCLVWRHPTKGECTSTTSGTTACNPKYGYADTSATHDKPGSLTLATYPTMRIDPKTPLGADNQLYLDCDAAGVKPDSPTFSVKEFDAATPIFVSGYTSASPPAGCPEPEVLTFGKIPAFRAFYKSTTGAWLVPCNQSGLLPSGEPDDTALGVDCTDPHLDSDTKLAYSNADEPSHGSGLSQMSLYICPPDPRDGGRGRRSDDPAALASPCVQAIQAHHNDSDPKALEKALFEAGQPAWRFNLVF